MERGAYFKFWPREEALIREGYYTEPLHHLFCCLIFIDLVFGLEYTMYNFISIEELYKNIYIYKLLSPFRDTSARKNEKLDSDVKKGPRNF